MTISTFAGLAALLCLQVPLSLASSSSSHNGRRHSNHHQSRSENICAASVPSIVNDTAEYWPYQTFQSFNATPPQLDITSNGKELADGLIFFGPDLLGGDGQPKELASFIMTDAGELVWSSPYSNDTTNFHTQVLDGKPVITYYTPDGPQSIPGLHWGRVHILDDTYTEIYTVCPKLGLNKGKGVTAECDADLHEHYITPENTMFVTAYNVTKADMTSLGGVEDDWVTDALVVEVDIKTGDILMVWSALEHIPINQTHATVPHKSVERPFAIDLYHINSIQSWGDYILVNSRHCWSTYLINRKTGEIEWTIDGETGGDFGSLPANGTFKWQHHARIKNISETEAILTYFNNDNNKATPGTFSTGLALKLTLPPNPKTPIKLLAEVYDENDEINAAAEGSMSTLYNGNYFMGYGFKAMMKEYGPGAAHGQDLRWSAQFATLGAGHSYRAFKQSWHALPANPPSLVVSHQSVPDELSSCIDSSTAMLGYVSWNGATDVSSYSLYGGHSEDDMKFLGPIKKMGFETTFPITQNVTFVMVSGGDPASNTVRNSTIVKIDWSI